MAQTKSRPQNILITGDTLDPLFNQFQSLIQAPANQLICLNWPENGPPPVDFQQIASSRRMAHGLIVIHRRSIGPTELSAISDLRNTLEQTSKTRPRLELILGDLVRYAEVQVLSMLVDRTTPESVAADLLQGRLARYFGQPNTSTGNQRLAKVGILSSNLGIAEMLADWVQWCGYSPLICNGWSDRALHSNSLMIWDVPTLSDRWLSQLRIQAHRRPVLTLLAMSNRDTTQLAKQAGAVASLDLPFDADDLADLLATHIPNKQDQNSDQAADLSRVPSVRLRSGKTILRAENGHNLNQDRAPWSTRSETQKSSNNKLTTSND